MIELPKGWYITDWRRWTYYFNERQRAAISKKHPHIILTDKRRAYVFKTFFSFSFGIGSKAKWFSVSKLQQHINRWAQEHDIEFYHDYIRRKRMTELGHADLIPLLDL